MQTRKITSVGNEITIYISSDIELVFSKDFVGIAKLKVKIDKPTLVILCKERTRFYPYNYWCFYNKRNFEKTCFCVSNEDLDGVDTLQLEFDKENNCLMSVNNEILSHTMD